jgi:ribosomal protein S18 acetylase RimI-like enzyme
MTFVRERTVGPGSRTHEAPDPPSVLVMPATADRWPDLEMVFGTRGDPSRCWCQWFFEGARIGPGELAASNKEALRAQVEAGPPPGVLAYLGMTPAGWTAAGPRPRYGRLQRSTVLRGTPADVFSDTSVWSVTCFVVKVGARRQGVAAALLRGAIDLARQGGAAVLEAYPVDLDRKQQASASELYHGSLSTFLRAGFVEIARPAPARPVVRLRLTLPVQSRTRPAQRPPQRPKRNLYGVAGWFGGVLAAG